MPWKSEDWKMMTVPKEGNGDWEGETAPAVGKLPRQIYSLTFFQLSTTSRTRLSSSGWKLGPDSYFGVNSR